MPPWLIISVKPASNCHGAFRCPLHGPTLLWHIFFYYHFSSSSSSAGLWKRKQTFFLPLHIHITRYMDLWGATCWSLPRVSFVLIELNFAWNVSSFTSAQKSVSPYILCKANVTGSWGQACPRHNGHREPAHINTQLRSCRHGSSLSIRMRMCRWGLLPCKAKPWLFIFLCLSASRLCVCASVQQK